MNKVRDAAVTHPDWSVVPGVHAMTTTRGPIAGESPYASLNYAMHVGDDATSVVARRERLKRDLGLPADPVWLNQVHGRIVIDASTAVSGAVPDKAPTADGAWTDRAGIVLAIMSADCLPVFLASRDGERVALLHAGWRGLADGVIEAGIAALNLPGQDLVAAFGPGIGVNAYEVGAEVRRAFADVTGADDFFPPSSRSDHYRADLYGLATQILVNAGVEPPVRPDHCTFDHADRWFSFRRQGECGRMVSLLWRQY